MDRGLMYVSSIPIDAQEKITARYGKAGKKRAEYYVGNGLVGIREFFLTGEPEGEWPFKNGGYHGTCFYWDEPGRMYSCEPYENGVPHGTAYQWAKDGTLIGSYTMIHGTGIDLWWNEWDGSALLTEVYYKESGKRHGFEWHWSMNGCLYEERHWSEGELHGIEREWNLEGGTRRGYPRYYVHGERMTKPQYLRACAKDVTLPPFRAEENARERVFPPEVAIHLIPKALSAA